MKPAPVSIAIAVIVATAVCAIVVVHYRAPVLYAELIAEDRLGEYVTAVSLGVAGLTLGALALRPAPWRRRAVWAGLAAAFIVVAFEEVSWGQRILRYDAPAFVKDRNAQEEMTLHNFDAMDEVLIRVVYNRATGAAIGLVVLGSAVLAIIAPGRWRRWRKAGVPLPGLACGACLAVVAALFLTWLLVKSDELAELFIGLAGAALAFEMLRDFGPVAIRRTGPQIVAATMLALAIALPAALLTIKRPGPIEHRLELLARRDYATHGLDRQAQMVLDHLAAMDSRATPASPTP